MRLVLTLRLFVVVTIRFTWRGRPSEIFPLLVFLELRRSCSGLQKFCFCVSWRSIFPAIVDTSVSISLIIRPEVFLMLWASSRHSGSNASSLCRNDCTDWGRQHRAKNVFKTQVLEEVTKRFGESRQVQRWFRGLQCVRKVTRGVAYRPYWRRLRALALFFEQLLSVKKSDTTTLTFVLPHRWYFDLPGFADDWFFLLDLSLMARRNFAWKGESLRSAWGYVAQYPSRLWRLMHRLFQ